MSALVLFESLFAGEQFFTTYYVALKYHLLVDTAKRLLFKLLLINICLLYFFKYMGFWGFGVAEWIRAPSGPAIEFAV